MTTELPTGRRLRGRTCEPERVDQLVGRIVETRGNPETRLEVLDDLTPVRVSGGSRLVGTFLPLGPFVSRRPGARRGSGEAFRDKAEAAS